MTAALPTETRPARLGALSKLPLFHDLEGKRVVVVGGEAPAAWKAELLAAAGAQVAVFATEAGPEIEAVADTLKNSLTLHRRAWRPNDLDGAWVAVFDAGGDEAEAERFARLARERGVLVNVIDEPGFCDFQFGTIVNRSPVVIGISTDGAAPILGQALRRRIEAVLPSGLGGWAKAAKAFRGRLRDVLPERADRRRFWERFVDVTFISQADEDAQLAEIERLAKRIAQEGAGTARRIGEVVLVGAGPGDPELLTLRAMRELQAADVIVYDRLVTPGVLELGRREARRILVGKEGHGAACRQEDISALLVDLALAGERVVRLKGGDPAIFGRLGEEVEACRAAGVPVQVVPGITSASAAAASLALSLTHRDHAQKVQFVTGHDRHGHLPDDLDLDALADPRATTVVYMGRRTATTLASALLKRGLAASTPVIVVTDVSRPQQQHRTTTLDELAAQDSFEGKAAPTLIMIGAALQTANALQPRALAFA
jgi:uroporphyrin-III C-methyltransferase/precorrin-2 dehydrogenase/sirohydrochlorin ferrochelatase